MKAKPKPRMTTTATTTQAIAPRGDVLRYVYTVRPRCPRCGSDDRQTTHSDRHGDGSISRRSRCRACNWKFIVVVE